MATWLWVCFVCSATEISPSLQPAVFGVDSSKVKSGIANNAVMISFFSKSKKSEDEAASTDKEEPSYMPSEMMLVSIASESMVNTSSPRSRQFTQRTESEFTS